MRPMFRQHGRPTKSSWLFLGEQGGPCDKSCVHCFYAHQKNLVFYDTETLFFMANKFRHYYGLEATDITGGEPTILGPRDKDGRCPALETLVSHCAGIGLAPSVITHGQNCTEALVKGVEDAGLDCWEFSIHGLGDLRGRELGTGHRLMVRAAGRRAGEASRPEDDGFARLVAGAERARRPRRWNCTVTAYTVPELGALARFLRDDFPPTVFNMIQFMPYHAWGEREPEYQWTYSRCGPHIAEAVELLEASGWEVNVRYFPPCVGRKFGFARNCIMHYQIQYDPWEWALEATADMPRTRIEDLGGVEPARKWLIDRAHKEGRQAACPPCQTCAARNICEGPDVQYTRRFGTEELTPFEGELIDDPNWFLKEGFDAAA